MIDRYQISQDYRKIDNANKPVYTRSLESLSNENLVEKYERFLSQVWNSRKLLKYDFYSYLFGCLGGFSDKTFIMWRGTKLQEIAKGYGDIQNDRIFLIDSIYYLYMLDIEIKQWIEGEQNND